MKIIGLTQGQFALVDEMDFDLVKPYKWCAVRWKNVYYAATTIDKVLTPMHRLILGVVDPKIIIDHKNGKGFDNRRCNIRIATNSQNSANRIKKQCGVYNQTVKQNGKIYTYWIARVRKEGKDFTTSHTSRVLAIISYNKMAVELFGDFARLVPVPEFPIKIHKYTQQLCA